MANVINNIDDVGTIIAKISAKMFADKCQFIKSVDKETSLSGTVNGFNKGDTINVNLPARFQSGTNADITSALQDVVEEKVALTLDTQRVTGVSLTSAEIATDLGLKSWVKRILEPAVSGLVQETENDILGTAVDATFNSVGTAGSTVFDPNTCLSAVTLLDNMLAPMDDKRKGLLYPAANQSASNARKGLFQSSEAISKIYKLGYVGQADGLTYLRNNLLPTHTLGNDVTGVAVDDAATATAATTLHMDGFTTTTGTITKGSVFTISDVNAVHPITKADLGYLQQFVATADGTADGSGDITVAISPTIYSSASNGLQNVSALPANDAAIVFVGAASTGYRQSLVYHPSAYRVAFAPLVKPDGVDMVGQETVDGVTVRVIRDYTVLTDKMIMRLDVLYGHKAVRPEWMCRITE